MTKVFTAIIIRHQLVMIIEYSPELYWPELDPDNEHKAEWDRWHKVLEK